MGKTLSPTNTSASRDNVDIRTYITASNSSTMCSQYDKRGLNPKRRSFNLRNRQLRTPNFCFNAPIPLPPLWTFNDFFFLQPHNELALFTLMHFSSQLIRQHHAKQNLRDFLCKWPLKKDILSPATARTCALALPPCCNWLTWSSY